MASQNELMVGTSEQPENGGSMVEVVSARQAQEVQAAMVIAKKYPRDEHTAIARLEKACKRVRLAEQSMYSYPRGDSRVTGPSIRLAETLAQCWGNLDFGIIELEQRNGESDVMAFCWDLETNTRQVKTFTVKHERHTKKGATTLTDPRDIYEMTANQGARRLRACILGVIPGDVQDLALDACKKTLAGDQSEPLVDRVRKMVSAFNKAFSVTPTMLELRLGHKLEACDENELAGLRSIYQSLKDGMSTRKAWFDLSEAENVESHKSQARAKGRGKTTKKPPKPDNGGQLFDTTGEQK